MRMKNSTANLALLETLEIDENLKARSVSQEIKRLIVNYKRY